MFNYNKFLILISTTYTPLKYLIPLSSLQITSLVGMDHILQNQCLRQMG